MEKINPWFWSFQGPKFEECVSIEEATEELQFLIRLCHGRNG